VSTTELRSKSRLPLAFSVPKREDQHNEDSFHRSAKGVYALSDGASVSFDSASWARILVRRASVCISANGPERDRRPPVRRQSRADR